jgi:hypothetical protein
LQGHSTKIDNQDIEKIIGMLAIIEARMDANTKTMQEKMDDNQTRIEADYKAWREKMRAETEAIRTESEATRAGMKAM